MPSLDGLGGVRLNYRQQRPQGVSVSQTSDAPALLFIHGAGCGSLHFAELVRILGRERRVVALDLPGHGQSAAFADEPDDAALLDRYVEVIADFGERIGLGRFVFAGHSMGGALGLLYALRYPDRLAGLALLATSAVLRVSRALMTMFDEHFDTLPLMFAQSSYSPASDPTDVACWAKEQLQCDKETLLADFRACDRFDLRERLSEIETVAVVVSARDDLLTPPKFQERLVEGLIRARLVDVPRAGHFVFRERPEVIVEAILSLERDPPRGGVAHP